MRWRRVVQIILAIVVVNLVLLQTTMAANKVGQTNTHAEMKRVVTDTAAGAAAKNLSTNAADTNSVATNSLEIVAERLEYNSKEKLLVGIGNVVVKQEGVTLRADKITLKNDTKEAHAVGNVILEQYGRVWTGEEVHYNFLTRKGDFGPFEGYVAPLYVYAEESRKVSTNVVELKKVTISSCEGAEPEFCGQAEKATLTDSRTIRAFNMTFYLGPVPVFFVPYYMYDMKRESHWHFLTGYRSRWGAFLLTTYSFKLTDEIESRSHFNFYTRRGVGFGQDFYWNNWEDETNGWRGNFRSFYINDQKPFNSAAEEQKRGDLVKNNRYRFALNHSQAFTYRDYGIATLNYLSDPYVIEDFFTEEYEKNRQPENRVSFSHQGDAYDAEIQVNKRLNNFYQNVDRIPEASLNFNKQEIADSGLYYQGNNAAAYLQQVFPNFSDRANYGCARVNSKNTLNYPIKLFGFLVVNPGAGYQLTYYSKTKEDSVVTNEATVFDPPDSTNNPTKTNITEIVTKEADGRLRHVPSLSLETSLKTFKVYVPDFEQEGGLRHIAKPYINYTLIPEPNLRPKNIYQFDEIDELDLVNAVTPGIRNELQTKRKKIVTDLINLDIYNSYFFQKINETDHDWGPLVIDLISYPIENLYVRLQPRYDWYASQFNQFIAQTKFSDTFVGDVTFNYQYFFERKLNQFGFIIDLLPQERWGFGTSWQYDVENDNLMQQSYYIQHKTDCLSYRVGYTGSGNDWNWWFAVSLNAFPDSQLFSQMHY